MLFVESEDEQEPNDKSQSCKRQTTRCEGDLLDPALPRDRRDQRRVELRKRRAGSFSLQGTCKTHTRMVARSCRLTAERSDDTLSVRGATTPARQCVCLRFSVRRRLAKSKTKEKAQAPSTAREYHLAFRVL